MTLAFLRGQVGYMREHGIEVHALSSPGPELDAFAAEQGVTAHAVEMPRRITPLHDLGAVARVGRVIAGVRPDIVHAHTPKGGLLGMIAARLRRVPVRVYHIHGMPYVTATGIRRRLLKETERTSCALAHQVFCVSESVRTLAVKDRVCRPGKVKVLAGGSVNGVDAMGRFNPDRLGDAGRRQKRRELHIPHNALVVGYVGRVVRDKGMVELYEAWRRLREEFPNLYLLIVGPVEPQDPVPEDVLAALRHDPHVRMPGADWDTPPLFAAMDVFLLPSYREGFPVTTLEAAAMALPVVTTSVPGCVDSIVENVTGTFVPPRDADALAEAVGDYLSRPDLRRQHGAAGRARVLRHFRQEVIWEALYEEYRRLVKSRTRFQSP
jgi:glycosyltransferase involved in cell wall biosynthesis